MRIPVVCPSCGASFTVSDQFAGLNGPCPKCKTSILVPTLAELGLSGSGASTPAAAAKPNPAATKPSPAGSKPGAATPGSSTTGGRLMPPGKAGPGAAGAASAPAAAKGAPPAKTAPPAGAGASAKGAPPAKGGPAAKPPEKPGKDMSPAAQLAAKLDNRSLIRSAPNKGTAGSAPQLSPGRPGAPQQMGIGTGRQAAITDEVVIHEPDEYAQGGVDKKGRPIMKPIKGTDAKFRPVRLALIFIATALVFILDWYVGRALAGKPLQHVVVWLIIAASSVPVALAGYWVLAPREAEPYTGTQLWIRVGACAAVYSLMWIARAFIPPDWTAEPWYWAMIAPPFFVAGAATAFLAFDLEGENTLFHFALFLTVSVLLRGFAGLPWV